MRVGVKVGAAVGVGVHAAVNEGVIVGVGVAVAVPVAAGVAVAVSGKSTFSGATYPPADMRLESSPNNNVVILIQALTSNG